MSVCAARGCEKPIKPGMLMCLPHWQKVPKAKQRDVRRTWREFSQGGGTVEERQASLRAYRVAVDAAVGSLPSPEQEWLGVRPETAK